MILVPDVSLWPQVAWKRYKRSRLSPVPPYRNTFKRSTPVSPRRSCVIILPAIPRRFCRESRASSPRPTCKPSNNCNNHILTVTYSKYKIPENHCLFTQKYCVLLVMVIVNKANKFSRISRLGEFLILAICDIFQKLSLIRPSGRHSGDFRPKWISVYKSIVWPTF